MRIRWLPMLVEELVQYQPILTLYTFEKNLITFGGFLAKEFAKNGENVCLAANSTPPRRAITVIGWH